MDPVSLFLAELRSLMRTFCSAFQMTLPKKSFSSSYVFFGHSLYENSHNAFQMVGVCLRVHHGLLTPLLVAYQGCSSASLCVLCVAFLECMAHFLDIKPAEDGTAGVATVKYNFKQLEVINAQDIYDWMARVADLPPVCL